MNKDLIVKICKSLSERPEANNEDVSNLINRIDKMIFNHQAETKSEKLLIALRLELLAHKLEEE